MKWYLPAWNGDFRLEAKGTKTELIVLDPTAGEDQMLQKFLAKCRHNRRKWVPKAEIDTSQSCTIVIDAPLEKVGPVLVKLAKPRDRTITALRFSDGAMEVAESADTAGLEALAEKTKLPIAKAAVSVARPTPCCPQCEPGQIEPATEVLLAFLNYQEHDDWARHRAIKVEGGLTGRRYVIAHRHSALARRFGRICYDLESKSVMHFFDWSVPPEEEVLAAKLILEHREPWLRNEATVLGRGGEVFKNPFGDISDGTETSAFTQGVGAYMSTLANGLVRG